QAAEHEVLKSTIKSQAPMHRSLMPEGLDALGAESLRDILAYLESGSSRFRVIDLQKGFTADGRLGLFSSRQALAENLEFNKHGHVQIGDVPFQIADPVTSGTGTNLLVLRGGAGEARNYP